MQDIPESALPASLYDPKEPEEDDLWFLPGPGEDANASDLPWPVAPRDGSGAGDWIAAEQANAVGLANAAEAWGALRDRMKHGGSGLRHRVALMLVADLSWHLGDRLTEDRIALYLAARITRAADDMPGFARAGWAMRRLLDGAPPVPGSLGDFLGRGWVEGNPESQLIDRPQGVEFAALEQEFWAGLSELDKCHPLTRAGVSWLLWQRLDLSGDANRIEGAVTAARLGGDPFLPIPVAPTQGAPADRLRAFYEGVKGLCLRGLMLLDQRAAWLARAESGTAHLSGRTPGLLIAALADWPMLSAEAFEQRSGASRAAVQRNLDRLAGLGLVREVTGQDRFRMWMAAG